MDRRITTVFSQHVRSELHALIEKYRLMGGDERCVYEILEDRHRGNPFSIQDGEIEATVKAWKASIAGSHSAMPENIQEYDVWLGERPVRMDSWDPDPEPEPEL